MSLFRRKEPEPDPVLVALQKEVRPLSGLHALRLAAPRPRGMPAGATAAPMAQHVPDWQRRTAS
jgi:hypothetical protein